MPWAQYTVFQIVPRMTTDGMLKLSKTNLIIPHVVSQVVHKGSLQMLSQITATESYYFKSLGSVFAALGWQRSLNYVVHLF